MNNICKYEIRRAELDEWEDAMALAWRTFQRFEAHEYSPEGIKNFLDFISDNALRKMFMINEYHLWVALDGNQIIGLISLRSGKLISLLFVDENYHKNGIGRRLLEILKCFEQSIGGYRLTVHSSPYAVDFYHMVGFVDTNIEQLKDGIAYTPMSWIF